MDLWLRIIKRQPSLELNLIEHIPCALQQARSFFACMQHSNAGKITTKMHMKINTKMKTKIKTKLIKYNVEPHVTLTIEPVHFIAASCGIYISYNTSTTHTCIGRCG